MSIHHDLEQVVRSWHALEAGYDDGVVVIDYDCAVDVHETTPGRDRLSVLEQLTSIRDCTVDEPAVHGVATANATLLGALLGERSDLNNYMAQTQGCHANGWTRDYVDYVGNVARTMLAELGIEWGAHTDAALRERGAPLHPSKVGSAIRSHADAAESAVRALTGAGAEFQLAVEMTDTDAYWSYWLDGAGRSSRLRINTRRADFNDVDAYRFALHEVLGHALQFANLAAVAESKDVDWPRVLMIHGPHQVSFEGLAQMLPLAIGADDERVIAQIRLEHYTQLVRSELHVLVNAGASARACRDHAAARVPFWTDRRIGGYLSDRGRDPQLRSYLWAYPAGLDWFMNLHDTGGSLLAEVLHAAYQRPLVPRELERLWPAGPRIGGNA